MKKGFWYVFINLQLAKVYVFVNESFANNKDLSSQIGFVLVISIKLKGVMKFILIRNIIYTNSTKCKRVTCVMLTLKLYAMVIGINMLIALLSTINIITNKLEIKQLLIIVYINFLLLYKCIIKFGIIKKKCLMIDIISIH